MDSGVVDPVMIVLNLCTLLCYQSLKILIRWCLRILVMFYVYYYHGGESRIHYSDIDIGVADVYSEIQFS